MRFLRTILVGATMLIAAPAAHAYVLAGPAAALQPASGPWSWDGAFNVELRGALQNPAYFGPAGVINETITTVSLNPINAGAFVGVDGFIAPWISVANSAPYEAAVVNFFLAGGDLWLLNDSTGRDGIAELLGVPTIGQNNPVSAVNGGAPLFNGPFGVAVNITQGGGEEGFLSAADVAARGGTVAATNVQGNVIAAIWSPGQYAPGAGALIIVADVDVFTTQASFNPLDDNGIFTLNTFAFLQAPPPPPPVPAPGALVLFGLAAAALLSARRR